MGLKILGLATGVRVRFPPSALKTNNLQIDSNLLLHRQDKSDPQFLVLIQNQISCKLQTLNVWG